MITLWIIGCILMILIGLVCLFAVIMHISNTNIKNLLFEMYKNNEISTETYFKYIKSQLWQ